MNVWYECGLGMCCKTVLYECVVWAGNVESHLTLGDSR
jgi:hypothetical protein